MTTIHNVIAIVPSNVNEDLEYRIECRAECIEDELMTESVAYLRSLLEPCDRIRLDELLSELAHNLASKEIKS